MPFPDLDGDIPCASQSKAQGLPAARSYAQRMAPCTGLKSSVLTSSHCCFVFLHESLAVLELPLSHPTATFLTSFVPLASAVTRMLRNLPRILAVSRISTVSQEAPYSLTSLLNLPPHLPESCSFSLFSEFLTSSNTGSLEDFMEVSLPFLSSIITSISPTGEAKGPVNNSTPITKCLAF